MQSDPFSPQFLRSFGITRLGEITGLDTIGIPVWFATRPNSRSLSISQGKGVTDDQAKISAVMEAVECAVAEQPRQHVTKFATIEDMARQQRNVIPLFDVARVNPHQLDPTRQRAWVPGTSLISGQERFAPYELVGMDMRSNMPWDREAFRMTSQGLAAHFSIDKAIEHALLELVEHDASSLVDTFGLFGNNIREVTDYEGANADLDDILDKVARAGLDLHVYALPGRVKLPVIAAVISRQVNGPTGVISRAPAGIACRTNVADAILSALLEAVQSRLTDIAGARDDLSMERFQQSKDGVSKNQPPLVSLAQLEAELQPPKQTSSMCWQDILKLMQAAGIEDAYLFPLKSPAQDVHVVRTIVTGLDAHAGSFSEMSMNSILLTTEVLSTAC
ncbi:ribosomal protein S12 methylthiotransferase accessory factor [Labrenzia sp. MBR-25]